MKPKLIPYFAPVLFVSWIAQADIAPSPEADAERMMNASIAGAKFAVACYSQFVANQSKRLPAEIEGIRVCFAMENVLETPIARLNRNTHDALNLPVNFKYLPACVARFNK